MGPIRFGLGLPNLNGFGVDKNAAGQVLRKRQTIRAERRRHARPGEELQLYCGMRTKHCFLIGRARCVSVNAATLQVNADSLRVIINGMVHGAGDSFARADGFADAGDMLTFWLKEHGMGTFHGVLITWEPLPPTGVTTAAGAA